MTGIKEIKTAEQILNKFKSFSIEVHKFDFEQGYIKEDVLAAMEEYKSQWDESKEETEKIIMKNIPKKIYLHVDSDHEPTNNFDALDVDLVYWTSKRQEESDIEYNLVEGDAVEKEQLEDLDLLKQQILERIGAGGKVADNRYRNLFGHKKSLYQAMDEYADTKYQVKIKTKTAEEVAGEVTYMDSILETNRILGESINQVNFERSQLKERIDELEKDNRDVHEYAYGLFSDLQKAIEIMEKLIHNTPSGHVRNMLTDVNIILLSLNINK